MLAVAAAGCLSGCGAAEVQKVDGALVRYQTAPLSTAGSTSSVPLVAGESLARTVAADEQFFALDLLRWLSPASPNLVLSPSSIAVLLAMLEPGAAAATEAGIAQALHSADLQPGEQALGWHKLDDVVAAQASQDHIVFDSANEVWLQLGLPVRPSYLSLLAAEFATGVQEQDFLNNPAAASEDINRWVASHTAGHITRLVTPAELRNVVAVLVDAVYMDAPWATPFNPSLTVPAPFHVSAAHTEQVPMMSTTTALVVPASATVSLDAAELPYEGKHLSALVLMPPVGQLGSFIARLTPAELAGIVADLRQQRAHIQLPRFTLGTDLILNGVLSAMGMGQAFSREADFSKLSPKSLQLAFVVHDAQMDVTERGTEASAASGAGVAPTAVAPLPALSITFNHPFVFLVRDDATGAVLFEAEVTNP